MFTGFHLNERTFKIHLKAQQLINGDKAMGRLTVHLQPEQNCILDGKLENKKKAFLQILYSITLMPIALSRG